MSLPCPDGLDAVAWAALPHEMRQELFAAHLRDQQPRAPTPTTAAAITRRPLKTWHGSAIPRGRSLGPFGSGSDANTCSMVKQGGWVSSITLDQEIAQCRKFFGGSTTTSCGDQASNGSSSSSQADVLFEDVSFPASASSIDGIRDITDGTDSKMDSTSDSEEAEAINDRELEKDVPMCKCERLARLRTVSKQGKNQGRRFWGCAKWGRNDNGSSSTDVAPPATQSCSFFRWATNLAHTKRDLSYVWMRPRPPPFYPPLVRHVQRPNSADKGPLFKASDVRQGRVGDCWFLAALATVAEQSDLVAKLVETTERSSTGMYVFRLFHKGKWVKVQVSDELPHLPKKATRKNKSIGALMAATSKAMGGEEERKDTSASMQGEACELAFSKGAQGLLWVPLLEKAYAKLHGSYHAISGGWVAEVS
jgi:hypothetical protein